MTIHKNDGWNFNWKSEFSEGNRLLYKLVVVGDNKIQALISLEIQDQYIEMHLIENAPHNFANRKKYAGCAGNLVAFACKTSFDLGFEGFVSCRPKSRLFDHYRETLGAERIYRDRMQIATDSAKKLVNSYYKNYLK